MKIYPAKTTGKLKSPDTQLTPWQKKLRQAALLIALVGVFTFFFKILFF